MTDESVITQNPSQEERDNIKESLDSLIIAAKTARLPLLNADKSVESNKERVEDQGIQSVEPNTQLTSQVCYRMYVRYCDQYLRSRFEELLFADI